MTKFELNIIPAFGRECGLVVVDSLVVATYEVVDDKIFTSKEVEIKDGKTVLTHLGADIWNDGEGKILQSVQLLDAEELKNSSFKEEDFGEFLLTETPSGWVFKTEDGRLAVPTTKSEDFHILTLNFDVSTWVETVWVLVDIYHP